MIEPKRVTVTLDSTAEKGKDTWQKCQAAGLCDGEYLESTGIITGSIAPYALESLKNIPGVVAVEEEHTYQLPPPNSDVQ